MKSQSRMCFEVKHKDGSKKSPGVCWGLFCLQGGTEQIWGNAVVRLNLCREWLETLKQSCAHLLIIHYMLQTPLRCVEMHPPQMTLYRNKDCLLKQKWFNDFLRCSYVHGQDCCSVHEWIWLHFFICMNIKIVQCSRTGCFWPCVSTVIAGKQQ